MNAHDEQLKRTSLYHSEIARGGRMVPFAGWEMPVQFEGITAEHKAVRSQAGLFDVSHMGEIEIVGLEAQAVVQRLVSNNVGRLEPGQALYTGMLYPNGTFVDDLLVYMMSPERYMLVVNAANTDKDFAWIKDNIRGNAVPTNISDTICQLALQGPRALAVFGKICTEPFFELTPFSFIAGSVLGCQAIISRTGYTGEDGLEIYLDWADGPKIWDAILEGGKDDGVLPIGLGARDTLRFEAGLPLYGNDISDQTTPLEAGLKWTVKFKKGDFIGRDALYAQKEGGIKRKLVGFQMIGKGIPRPHYPVYVGGKEISEVASGGLAIWLGTRNGTTYLPIEYTEIGTMIEVDIRGKLVEAEVCPFPFYKREKLET